MITPSSTMHRRIALRFLQALGLTSFIGLAACGANVSGGGTSGPTGTGGSGGAAGSGSGGSSGSGSACGPACAAIGVRCQADADCCNGSCLPDKHLCSDMTDCQKDSDCPSCTRCDTQMHTCVPSENRCHQDADCPLPNQMCDLVFGGCVDKCKTDSDCPDYYCSPSGGCYAYGGGGCNAGLSLQCSVGVYCVGGGEGCDECVAAAGTPCQDANACTCVNHLCANTD